MTSNNLFLNSKAISPTPPSQQPAFAEIIESSLDHCTVQCWEWDNFPSFGNLIIVPQGPKTIIGCVTQVRTGSMDPMRYPFPYQKTEEELRAEQPQIFEFLKTTFTIQILGYADLENNKAPFIYLLPPKPAKIHSFASYASMEVYANFFAKPHYLNILFAFAANVPNLDELLLAILHNLAQRQLLAKEQFGDFCETFSLLTGNDYRRLKLFLKRVEDL